MYISKSFKKDPGPGLDVIKVFSCSTHMSMKF